MDFEKKSNCIINTSLVTVIALVMAYATALVMNNKMNVLLDNYLQSEISRSDGASTAIDVTREKENIKLSGTLTFFSFYLLPILLLHGKFKFQIFVLLLGFSILSLTLGIETNEVNDPGCEQCEAIYIINIVIVCALIIFSIIGRAYWFLKN